MPKTNILITENDIEVIHFSYKEIDFWRHRNLSAPYWRIIHNKKGISELFFKDNISRRRISLPDSIIMLIPPNINYSSSNSSSILHFELLFNLTPPPLSVKEPFFTFPFEGKMKDLIELLHEYRTEKPSLFTELIMEMLTKIADKSLQLLTEDTRLNRAIVHMNENKGKPLSNRALADDFSMSVNGFARLFREKTGHTPYEYQLRLRIDRARIMLQFTPFPIELIAKYSGFTNRFHFSKTFKKIVNRSPGEYRKNMK